MALAVARVACGMVSSCYPPQAACPPPGNMAVYYPRLLAMQPDSAAPTPSGTETTTLPPVRACNRFRKGDEPQSASMDV